MKHHRDVLSFAPRLRAPALIVFALVVIAAACVKSGGPAVGCDGGDVQVVVTLPIFADFACEVGGEQVTVTALIPADANAFTFEPGPEAAEDIRQADLVLYNGLGLDQPALDFIFSHASGRTQIIGYAFSVPSPTAEQPIDDIPITAQQAGDNPVLWLDPEVARVYVESTRDSLEIVDQLNISVYKENATRYLEEIDELAAGTEEVLAPITQERRQLATLYDSFPHFGRAYGFDVLGFLSSTPRDEPSQGDVDDLIAAVAEAGIPAVFAERGFDRTIMAQVAEQAGVDLCLLYGTNVDEGADTYLEMMRANAKELARCLQ